MWLLTKTSGTTVIWKHEIQYTRETKELRLIRLNSEVQDEQVSPDGPIS